MANPGLIPQTSLTDENYGHITDVSWDIYDMDPKISLLYSKRGFTTPSLVQNEVLKYTVKVKGGPDIEMKNLVVQSATGSGKTVAYLIPTVLRVNPMIAQPQGMIIVPTLELVRQVYEETHLLARELGVTAAMIKHDTPLEKITSHIVIGAPGLLERFVKTNRISTENLKTIIFDEADQFVARDRKRGQSDDLPALKEISKKMEGRPDILRILLSATFPETIRNLEKAVLPKPRLILRTTIPDGPDDTADGPAAPAADDSIELPRSMLHFAVVSHDAPSSGAPLPTGGGSAPPRNKDKMLISLLRVLPINKAFIFLNSSGEVEKVYKAICKEFPGVDFTFGKRAKEDREKSFSNFRSGATRIMVSTNMLGRGIDIPDANLVILYDVPNEPVDYVHRAGRTSRFGREGRVVTLLGSPEDERKLAEVEAALSTVSIQRKELDDILVAGKFD